MHDDHSRLFAYARDVYELENNFSAIYPRRLGSFKSFYDTAVSYPSLFTAAIGRKLIKANGECELQLQETRASRSRVDRRDENSPSGYRNHNRGRLRELIDAETRNAIPSKFDTRTTESHYESNKSGIFERRCAVNGTFDVSER